MIDLKRIEYLCSGGFDGSELQDEAPELVTWVREAVRLMELCAQDCCDDTSTGARELRKHIAKVKLEES